MTLTATRQTGSIGAPSLSEAGRWLSSLSPKKLRRVAGPYIIYPIPHGMDGPCPGLRTGDAPCRHPCPHALFQQLPPQPGPLPVISLNTVPGAKGVYLTAGATLSPAIPLHQIQHMASGARLPDTKKPRHPLAGHGARDPRPTDPNAPGPDRALLHLTMKPTTQLPATLEGENTSLWKVLQRALSPLWLTPWRQSQTHGMTP